MEDQKKRRPIVALLLSFLTPGLGQIYNGQLKKAVSFYLAECLLVILLLFSDLFLSFFGMVMFLLIGFSIGLFSMLEALWSAIRLKRISLKKYNRWYYYLGIIFLNLFILSPTAKSVIPIKAYRMPAGSMSPALVIGDHFIVNKKAFEKQSPNRGDIVIFQYPVDPSKDFIKRVIGLPGEILEIRDKKVFVNNQLLEEPYVKHTDPHIISAQVRPRDNFGPITVPNNSLFVMGDNRDESFDSRFWGFVDASSLKGKALYIYWSENKSRIGRPLNRMLYVSVVWGNL